MINQEYLVTVLVVTYNSSNSVLATLESIKRQTYRKIELIVSDDCSTDDTVEKCINWGENNKHLFVAYDVLTSDINTGVPANCNRGLYAARGQYLKIIAGDDILMDMCIEDLLNFASNKSDFNVGCSSYRSFEEVLGKITIGKRRPSNLFIKNFNNNDARRQLKTYLLLGENISPSAFYRTDFLRKVGPFDESYKLFEDTPMFVKILLSGSVINYLNKDTVLYRVSSSSITRNEGNIHFYKTSFVECETLFHVEHIYPIMRWNDLWYWIPHYSERLLYYFTISVLHNKKNSITSICYYFAKMINPFFWYKSIRNRFFIY